MPFVFEEKSADVLYIDRTRYTHMIDDTRILQSCRLQAGETLHKVDLITECPQQPFHFTLSSGRHLILKLSSPSRWVKRDHDAFAYEIAVLQMMTDAGIPTPQVFSNTCLGVACARDYLLLDHGRSVPFCTLTAVSEEQRATVAKSLGDWLKRVGAVHSTAFGAINGVPRSNWRECFRMMFEGLLVEAQDMMVQLPYDHIRAVVKGLAHALDTTTIPGLVILRSSSLSNVMVDPSSMVVTGLVDYSNILWGDPAMMYESTKNDNPAGTDSNFPEARHLLYSIYAACSEIVSCCTGPPRCEMSSELIARKRLMQGLMSLGTAARGEQGTWSDQSSAKL